MTIAWDAHSSLLFLALIMVKKFYKIGPWTSSGPAILFMKMFLKEVAVLLSSSFMASFRAASLSWGEPGAKIIKR